MSMSELPPINNEVIFEEFCKDLWKDILKYYTVERYGRRGQSQEGVDVACISKDEVIGIQCKRVEKLTENDIDKEINLAKNFEPKLDKYIIATTLKKDKNLQKHVFKKSIENEQNGLFKIEIIFWDGLTDKIFNESNNIDLFKKYFPEQSLDVTEISQMLDYISTQFKEENYKTAENSLNFIKQSVKIKTNKNRNKLYNLEAKYLSICRKFKKAGEKYIQAYAVSSKDNKSKYYYALGLFYSDKFKESRDICKDILKENPLNPDAYSILVLIDNDINIPKELIDSPEINYNLGISAILNKRYKESYEFFKKLNLKKPIELLNCANTRLVLFDENDDYPFNIDLKEYNKSLKIEKIFQDVFDKFTEIILSNYFDIFANLLALNKYHKHFDALEKNVDRLLSINSDDENILFYKAVLLERKEKPDEALEILKKIPAVLDSLIFIIKILIGKKDTEQAIKYAEYFYDDKDSKNYLFCQEVLIDSYVKVGRKKDAKILIESIEDVVRHNFFKSKLYDDKNEKMRYLLKCYEHYENAFIIDKLNLAQEFTNLNEFKKAITIYETTIDLIKHSTILDELAYCYLYNEDYDKLIDLIESFMKKGEHHKYLIEYGIEGYLHLNKFREAKELMETYSKEFGEKYSIELAKAKIDFINGNYKEVDAFLEKKHDLENLSPSQCISLYGLFKERNSNPIKSFELLYTIKKIHKQELMVHKVYIQEFNDKNITFIDPVKINWNDYVLIEYLEKTEWLCVSKKDKDKTKFHKFEKIINHETGEVIEINPNFKIKIIKIKNKFTHEFCESKNILIMNNSNFFQTVEFKTPKESDEESKMALRRSNELLSLKRKYLKKLCPIFVFSITSRLDMLGSCIYLRSHGLKSFNRIENNQIPLKQNLLFDITSLLTIYELKIEDIIADNYSVRLSYAEYFLLKEIQKSTEANLNNSQPLVVTIDNEFKLIDTNKSKFIFVNKLIDWIDENCELISLNPKIKPEIRKTLNKLPKNINENIQIALDGNLLASDDLDFKKIIYHDFKINSCSTLTLIYDMYGKKLIDEDKFEELLSKLYELNYKEVPITVELIVKFIKKGNYNVLIKLIREVSFNPKKYLHVNWRSIIKSLDSSNVKEYVLFILIKNTFSELDFNTYINPLDVEIKEFFGNVKFVASTHSKVYHDVNCQFAKKISESNLICFANEHDALSKGYVKCDKC